MSVTALRCEVDGCPNFRTTRRAKYCETHWYRLRRTGTTDDRVLKLLYNTSNGYMRRRAPDHPLANSGGTVLEHRYVYFNAHGEGPFECHWCGTEVTWATVHIDHLDDNKKHNAEDNLVASCELCNTRRGCVEGNTRLGKAKAAV